MPSMPWMRIRDAIVAGAVAGLAAGLVFATLHAFIIEPIWSRMFGGLFGAMLTGAVVAWGFSELGQAPTALNGMRFGALLWLAVAPVSLSNAALRASAIALPRDVEDALAIALAL